MKQPKLNPSKSTGLKISKKKRKFRAVTKGEWCSPKRCPKCEYHYAIFYCDYSEFNGIHKRDDSKPYKKRNGKYILVEVTNDA